MSDIENYTWTQFQLFLGVVASEKVDRLLEQFSLTFVAARGDKQAVSGYRRTLSAAKRRKK